MTTVQIKNVPEETHRVLRTRAAHAHQSLQEYLLSHLVAEAARPTTDEWLASVAQTADGKLSVSTINQLIREDRDRR